MRPAMPDFKLPAADYSTEDIGLSHLLQAVEIAVDDTVCRTWVLIKLLEHSFDGGKVSLTGNEFYDAWLAGQASERMDALKEAFGIMWHSEQERISGQSIEYCLIIKNWKGCSVFFVLQPEWSVKEVGVSLLMSSVITIQKTLLVRARFCLLGSTASMSLFQFSFNTGSQRFLTMIKSFFVGG